MALHRDIYWVGRQWAVTGSGVQAVDPRLKGVFDIEIARLWDDELPQRMRALAWLKADDFETALGIARSRFPEPPHRSLPLVESVLELISPVASEPPTEETTSKARSDVKSDVRSELKPIEANEPSREPPGPAVEASPVASESAALDPPPPHALALRIEQVSAKFLPRWRIRH